MRGLGRDFEGEGGDSSVFTPSFDIRGEEEVEDWAREREGGVPRSGAAPH